MCSSLGASVGQKEDSERGLALPGWGALALGRDTPAFLPWTPVSPPWTPCRLFFAGWLSPLRPVCCVGGLWLDPLTAPDTSRRVSKLLARCEPRVRVQASIRACRLWSWRPALPCGSAHVPGVPAVGTAAQVSLPREHPCGWTPAPLVISCQPPALVFRTPLASAVTC